MTLKTWPILHTVIITDIQERSEGKILTLKKEMKQGDGYTGSTVICHLAREITHLDSKTERI